MDLTMTEAKQIGGALLAGVLGLCGLIFRGMDTRIKNLETGKAPHTDLAAISKSVDRVAAALATKADEDELNRQRGHVDKLYEGQAHILEQMNEYAREQGKATAAVAASVASVAASVARIEGKLDK